MKFDALAVLTGLVGAAEAAGPMGCGRCVEPMTGRTGSLRCEHAEEFATRLFHASAAIHAPPLPSELLAHRDEFSAPGHCGHAPKCINDGVMDDRDPLGCCNCGTRKAEEAAELKALRETVRMSKSLLVRLERDAPHAVWEWLVADGVLADLRETLGVKS